MSIRHKVILVVFFVSLVYSAMVVAVVVMVVYPNIESLERTEALEDANRIIQAVLNEADHLRSLTHDWSAWNDTYQFALDRNRAYIESNLLDETFINTNVDLIYITDGDGNVIYGRVYGYEDHNVLNLTEEPTMRLSPNHPLFLSKDPLYTKSGLIAAEPYPLIVASQPIITSDNKGPVRGFFIMGKFLDEEYNYNLEKNTMIEFDIINLKTNERPLRPESAVVLQSRRVEYEIIAVTKNRLNIGIEVNGVDNNPAIFVKCYIPRDITKNIGAILRFSVAAIITSGLFILLSLSIHIGVVIVEPLSSFSRKIVEIRKSGNLSRNIGITRKDEIGMLAKEFDFLLSELREARKQLSEQAYRAGLSDMSSGLLHNFRNSATPMMQSIHKLETDFESFPCENIERAVVELGNAEISEDRKLDLIKYISLAYGRMAQKVTEMKVVVETLTGQSKEIVELLNQHESITRSERMREEVEIRELIEDAYKLVPEGLRNLVRLKCTTKEPNDVIVIIDRLVLLHVLLNLFDNSAESINRAEKPNGEISVDYGLATEQEQRFLYITVEDNGEGIDDDNYEKLFKRGYTSKPLGKGGFGLHWCANAISSQKGKITAVNLGKGTGMRFLIRLPIDII